MEISRADRKRESRDRVRGGKSSSAPSPTSVSFLSELQRVQAVQASRNLDDMLEELSRHEERFLGSQSLSDLAVYRNAVSAILKHVLDNALETRVLKKSRPDSEKIQTVVDLIDEKLLAVSQAITSHNRAFNLMKSIDEIRGLILDLVY